MHLATIDGKELTRALRWLKSSPGKKLGSAFWLFGEDLRLEWSGAVRSLDAQVWQPVADGIMVDCEAMKHVTARLTYSGPTEIRFADSQLLIGRDRFAAQRAAGPRAFALPVDADEGDVLLALLGYGHDATAQSGYEEAGAKAVERLEESLIAVGKATRWTGLSQYRLGEIVMEELGAMAQRQKQRYAIDNHGE